MNKAMLIGRITTKPELRTTSSGTPYTRFSIAINRQYANENGEKETDFINILVWRKQAENVCNFLDKGSQVAIEGRIQTGNYTDKDGNNRNSFEVVADNIQFLDKKNNFTTENTPSDDFKSVSIEDDFLE